MSGEVDLTPIEFDSLELKEVEVKLAGKEYILREASSAAGVMYRNAMLKATKLNPETGKPASLENFADAEPLLVSLCLVRKEDGAAIPLTTIKTWPSKVVTDLFDRAKAISNLEEKKDIEALTKQRDKLDKQIADEQTREARLGKPLSSMILGSA